VPFWPATAPILDYLLPEYGVSIGFLPTDFTQINHTVNRVLVRRALGLLEPRPGEKILDLFCGLGNFTLPIGRSGASVKGIEGSAELVARAEQNALRNGLSGACRFLAANLSDGPTVESALAGEFRADKALIDPPREGAVEVVKRMDAASGPRRIVYVSCEPGTLARDAAILVGAQGYRLEAAGVVNMFPHTSHVESVALFEAE
jgi:23S rRNA (uracil1939-C5)-methyltransferase